MENKEITPIVKWAGGKRQLLDRIRELAPVEYNAYYEPFIGGGAVLFGLTPDNATINDINEELINLYKVVKEKPAQFIEEIKELDKVECDKEFYYSIREKYNNKLIAKEYDVELAVLFVWLNKHCFNVLYRVNSKCLFNVPYNNKGSGASVSEENVYNMSNYLSKVGIRIGDFEEAVENAGKGDFVFFDSPYAPLKADSFDDYTKEGFSEENHRRLAKLFDKLTEKGCYCMLTNHDTDLIRELYGKYNIEVVDVKRLINRNAENRKGKEVIITNYL